MKEIKNINILIFMSLGIVVNFVGGYIALLAKLPIYLDSIGTLLSAVMFGPFCGAVVGGMTSIINGATFDPVSFYFAPVQIIAGISTGFLFKSGKFEGLKSILSILIVAILVSMASSIIVSFVFDGVTSSGSSLIVAILRNAGVNLLTAVFSIQVLTDLLDKVVSFSLVFCVIKTIPSTIKLKLTKSIQMNEKIKINK
ncbi:MAG: ECF transporter S component [Eubacterium sp.]